MEPLSVVTLGLVIVTVTGIVWARRFRLKASLGSVKLHILVKN
jgi:hypothetical protein